MTYKRTNGYQSKRRRQKQKIRWIKAVVLCLFLGCVVGVAVLAWNYLGVKEKAPTGPLVCIDAGHGGVDVGAIGEGERYEKDDNLRLALQVQKQLEAKGIQVLMTRENDTKLTLEDRCYIANKKDATLFVSIHRNSAAASANGIEIWTANKGTGNELANYIYEELQVVGMQTDRGIQKGTIDGGNSDYFVNKHTKMPSCLIEMGFITNEEDNRLLDTNLEAYAQAIANGIEKTLVSMETAENKE